MMMRRLFDESLTLWIWKGPKKELMVISGDGEG